MSEHQADKSSEDEGVAGVASPAESVADTSGTMAQPSRGGAPRSNRNNFRHGLYAVGRMPLGASYIAKIINKIRATIEAELIARDGEIGVYAAAVVNEFLRAERAALLLSRWLRVADDATTVRKSARAKNGVAVSKTETKGLTVMERAAILRDIQTATARRNASLRELGLNDIKRADPWAMLKPVALIPQTHAPTHHTPRQRTQNVAGDPNVVPPVG